MHAPGVTRLLPRTNIWFHVQFAESAWLLNVHEPLLWRLVEMLGRLKLARLVEQHSTSVTVDPRVRIGLLNLTDLHFKLTLLLAPAQRPRGILGFWSTLVTSIGNTNEMQVGIPAGSEQYMSIWSCSNCLKLSDFDYS